MYLFILFSIHSIIIKIQRLFKIEFYQMWIDFKNNFINCSIKQCYRITSLFVSNQLGKIKNISNIAIILFNNPKLFIQMKPKFGKKRKSFL